MALSTIRKMTDEDRERINATAIRFLERHPELGPVDEREGLDAQDTIVYTIDHAKENDYPFSREHAVYLRRLWLACWRRAVRHPSADASGYGYIGYNVD